MQRYMEMYTMIHNCLLEYTNVLLEYTISAAIDRKCPHTIDTTDYGNNRYNYFMVVNWSL